MIGQMKWKDPVVANELIKRIKSNEKRIENYETKLRNWNCHLNQLMNYCGKN